MTTVFFAAEVSEAEAASLAGGALMLLPPAGEPAPLALARDSQVLSAACELLPVHLAHLGGQTPGSEHALYWLKVAADIAHRSGS